MPTTEIEKIKEQLSSVLSVIEPQYIDTILSLHERLDKSNVQWAIGGDLGEQLRAVKVKPDCMEVLTDKSGSIQIALILKDLAASEASQKTTKLSRNAVLDGKEYPVYERSYYVDFTTFGVQVKVHGDLQIKVGDWEWGEKLEFTPEHVSVVGFDTAIVPLKLKREIYEGLGWTDRVERINRVINRHPLVPR